mgnify:CR=1 FL=1|tara:strand:- start:1923 stop:2354 length:432 start_codon:yes stop_codon:yes gene_type:complete
MVELVNIIEEFGILGAILIFIIIVLRLGQRYGLNMKCGPFSIDLRRPQTKQKQLKYDSVQELQKLKNEELSLRIREKEIELKILETTADKNKEIVNTVSISSKPNIAELTAHGLESDAIAPVDVNLIEQRGCKECPENVHQDN